MLAVPKINYKERRKSVDGGGSRLFSSIGLHQTDGHGSVRKQSCRLMLACNEF